MAIGVRKAGADVAVVQADAAAERDGCAAQVKERIREMVATERPGAV